MTSGRGTPRAARVGVVDPPGIDEPGTVETIVDTGDLTMLERAYHGADPDLPPVPVSVRDAQLTITRQNPDDVPDRQIYIFVDEEPWGKVRYGQSLSREVKPGRHRVRAFNTLFSRTVELDVRPAEHARLRCGNGFPRAGYLLFMVLHVTYLLVRLEREPPE